MAVGTMVMGIVVLVKAVVVVVVVLVVVVVVMLFTGGHSYQDPRWTQKSIYTLIFTLYIRS